MNGIHVEYTEKIYHIDPEYTDTDYLSVPRDSGYCQFLDGLFVKFSSIVTQLL